MHNKDCTCDNCPRVDKCIHSKPETFENCPEWVKATYGYMLKDMRVMILGIDGFLGWTLALWLGSLGFEVSGVDNHARREWVAERGAGSVVPISHIAERLATAREILGIDLDFRRLDILKDHGRLREFVEEIRPDAIVHYGECPSAPYSMIDFEHARFVQENNILGTLGILFIMRDLVPNSSIIKLGTMGELGTPLTGRPLFEGCFAEDSFLEWKGQRWSLEGELIPRNPGSLYHASKIHDTYNIYKACHWWKLRSIDVMQGVIYGVHTPQVASDSRLRTRLDIDEWFGTVINRFIAQAVIGIPLTVYGAGGQTRGYLTLEDAMQCMTRLILHPPVAGEYEVVNQFTETYSIRELAAIVVKVGHDEYGLDVRIQRVENPRIEAEQHPYEAISEKLPLKYGFKPAIGIEEEVARTFELLMQPEIKSKIEQRRHLILPRTHWSGEKRVVKPLEEL